MPHPSVAYIAADRYAALLENRDLPARENGSALFADITGFTPLTAAYVHLLGARLGTEELTHQLNLVYDELIADVSRFGGSVIGFSGDAIMCWFGESWPRDADSPPADRAVACGQAMLQSIAEFSTLSLPDGTTLSIGIKVAVASGLANRFLVGDPNIQYIDLLAGGPVERTAVGEHLIRKGELIIDAATAALLDPMVEIAEWRSPENSTERYAVVRSLQNAVQPISWPEPGEFSLSHEVIRPWLLPQVYERLQENGGEFPAELRPAVPLFLRFVGIDFDAPSAGEQLDTFLLWVQAVLMQYEGTLIQVTLGDKGSYLYAAFGAPFAHEDDARRAVAAALELRTLPANITGIDSIQIGISQGTVRVGAYGGSTRRTYGVLGDEVNVAARLMQHARPGEVIASRRIQAASSNEFKWELLPPLLVKGKAEPLAVSRLLSRLAVRQRKSFGTALIGREPQLQQLMNYLAPLWEQQFAGAAYVVGEAGMGKSRLLSELQSRLQSEQEVFWMTCVSDEIFRDSFHPFRHFLRDYFSQSPEQTTQQNFIRFRAVLDGLRGELEYLNQRELNKTLTEGESFLAALVDLHWEDARYRKAEPRERLEWTLEALKTLIHAESLRQPVIIHIEDAHWLDADSIELLKLLCQSQKDHPVAIVMTCRDLEDGGLWAFGVEEGIRQEVCNLHELSQDSIHDLARELLSGPVNTTLSAFLLEKTGGNPFFVEQLLFDLRERGVLIQQKDSLWSLSPEALIEVPSTVNAVLIARLDRLAGKVRLAVQMASVLGQEFELRVLSHMLTDASDMQTLVKEAEAAAVWLFLREGRYGFRHALLRDAAYEMQLSVRQRELHRTAAGAIETVYGEEATSQATELAYHYERAVDMDKAAQWHTTSGSIGLKTYALENVVFHYRKAMTCWQASEANVESYRASRLQVLLELGNALRWLNRSAEAAEIFRTALDEAALLKDDVSTSDACTGLAAVQYDEGDFRSALENAVRAEQLAGQRGISRKLRTILEMKCWSLFRLGELEAARDAGEKAVSVSKALNESGHLAQSLSVLGLVLMASGENQQAAEHFEHALSIASDPMDVLGVTNNLGVIAVALGDYERAALRFEEALALARQHKIAEAELVFRSNLGGAHVGLGSYPLAKTELCEVIDLTRGSNFGDLSETYRFLAEALLGQDRIDEALEAANQALTLGREVGAPEFVAIAWRVLGQAAARRSASVHITDPDTNELREYSVSDCFSESLRILEMRGMKGEIPRTLRAWALYELEKGNLNEGSHRWQKALDGFSAVGAVKEIERMHTLANRFPEIAKKA